MKLKLVVALFASTLWCSWAQAQVPTPIVAGVITADVGRNSNFKIIVNQTVNSVVLSSSSSPAPGQYVTLFFTENATGGFAVTFGGNISNPCTVSTTANATTNCSFQYDSTSNTWFGVSGGSSSGSGLPVGFISPSSPSTLCPTCTGKADLQGVTDATITNGSSSITTGGSDPAFTSADTGKDCFATTGGGPALARVNGKLSLAEGTFTQTGAHTGTCSTTANANASGTNNNFFFWGTNDTAAMTAAWTAASPASGPCKSILLPGSAMLVTTNFGSSASGTCGFNLGGQKEGMGIAGNSFGSILVIGPAFDFTTQCPGGASSNVCLFAQTGLYLNSLVVYGAERADCPAAAGGKILVGINGDSIYDVVQLVGWCANAVGGTTTGFAPASTSGASANYMNVDGFGTTCVSTSNYPFRLSSYFAGDCQLADIVVSGGVLTSSDGFWGDTNGTLGNVQVTGGIFQSTGDNCANFTPTANIGLKVNTGAVANITDMQCYAVGNTTSSALWVAGGTVNISLSLFKGGSGTGVDIFLDTGGHLNNLGGNTFGQGHVRITAGTTTKYTGLGVFAGVGQGVGTAASTLGMYGLGQRTTPAFTSTTVNLGETAQNSGSVYGLLCTATAGGTNASSGVCTLLKNNAAQATTCTMGTGTSCRDDTTGAVHTWTFVQGDVISCQITTQAADTLAGVICVPFINYI